MLQLYRSELTNKSIVPQKMWASTGKDLKRGIRLHEIFPLGDHQEFGLLFLVSLADSNYLYWRRQVDGKHTHELYQIHQPTDQDGKQVENLGKALDHVRRNLDEYKERFGGGNLKVPPAPGSTVMALKTWDSLIFGDGLE